MILKRKKAYPEYSLTFNREYLGFNDKSWCGSCLFNDRCDNKTIKGVSIRNLCLTLPGMTQESINCLKNYVYVIKKI